MMPPILLIAISIALSILRPFMPTVGLSWATSAAAAIVIVLAALGAWLRFRGKLTVERAGWLQLGAAALAFVLLPAPFREPAPFLFFLCAHGFVGVMIASLIWARGRWALGWVCLAVPTMIELALFLAARG